MVGTSCLTALTGFCFGWRHVAKNRGDSWADLKSMALGMLVTINNKNADAAPYIAP